MSNELAVNVRFGVIPDAIRRHPYDIYARIARPVVEEGTEFYAGRLALNTPVGATGKARQAVTPTIEQGLTEMSGHVDYAEPASAYIMFADQGTRPHWPPYEPIAYWAARVLGTSDPRIVGAIRRGIARKGTKAQKFVERTVNENEYEALQVMASAAARAVIRLNSGGETSL